MRNKKNDSNYFDDWDMWQDTPTSHKQDPFKDKTKKEPRGFDDFFDDFSDDHRSYSKTSSGRQGSGGSQSNLPTILTVLVFLALIIFSLGRVSHIWEKNDSHSDLSSFTVPKPSLEEPELTPIAPSVEETVSAPVPQVEYRHFGRMLNDEQKRIYAIVLQGIAQRQDSIGPLTLPDEDTIDIITQSIWYDYPEYFWFRGGFSGSYYSYDTHVEYTLCPDYAFTAQEYSLYASFIEDTTQPLLDELSTKTDYEKVKGVYEYLIDNTAYDLRYKGTTLYEIFHDGRAVCEGYSRATQYLLTKLGVETLFCTGIAGEVDIPRSQWENHAWNLVKIDGSYYGVDTTWGDPLNDDGSQTKLFWFLNLTDMEMERRHERDEWNYYPVCTDVQYNYFVQEGRYLQSFSKETITRWFQEAYANGQPLEFKCANEATYHQVYHWLVDNEGFSELFKTVIPPNESYRYFYLYNDELYILQIHQQ